MAEVKWVKISTDIFENPKIVIISEMKDGSAMVLAWIKLITLAGRLNNSGKFSLKNDKNFDEKTIAKMIKISPKKFQNYLKVFEEFEMIFREKNTIFISNWDKYQSEDKLEKIRQQTRKRVQIHREKQERYNSVTERYGNATEVEIDIEEEKERDIRERKSCCRSLKENDNSGDGVTDKSDDPNDRIERWGGELGKGVVYLSQNQFDSLLDILGMDGVNRYLSKLADFIIEKDAKVKNHYETILRWYEEDRKIKL